MNIAQLSCALAIAFPAALFAQVPSLDLADKTLIASFQRDNASFLCLEKSLSPKEIRSLLDPYIPNVDVTKEESYPAIAGAVYEAFPCPFSAARPELQRATRQETIGRWLFPQTSVRLRHGPKSPAWHKNPGMPPIKCEAVIIQETGAYRVATIQGEFPCPDAKSQLLSTMESAPQVSTWKLDTGGRLNISRSDVPAHYEEWDLFSVKEPFEAAGTRFSPGELLAFLRREPGNQIGAVTAFRHLQRLK